MTLPKSPAARRDTIIDILPLLTMPVVHRWLDPILKRVAPLWFATKYEEKRRAAIFTLLVSENQKMGLYDE